MGKDSETTEPMKGVRTSSDASTADERARRLVVEGLTPEIAGWLARFQPRGSRREAWPKVAEFVVKSVVALQPKRRPGAESYVWALTALSTWGLDRGLELSAEVLLHPDTVEIFATTALGDGSQKTARSILRRIGPRLTSRAPWPPAPNALKPRGIAPPYSPSELESLRLDVARQSTPNRVRAARAILTLGAGAGLDGRWNMDVCGADVEIAGGVVILRVGPPAPRTVPVLATFEDDLLELAALAGEDFLVGGEASSKNKASRALARYEAGPGRPRLSASRARSTWLLAHLTLGTRLPELALAAGFANVSSLNDLIPDVPAMFEQERLRMLRGAK